MLEHVDTVLSFAVVMLLLSLLVTTWVQIVVTATALRSKTLKLGIERLLKQVDPKLKDHAAQIAAAVVCHPAVVTEKTWPSAVLEKLWLTITRRQAAPPCATDIKKEELIRVLGDLAANPPKAFSRGAKKTLKDLVDIATLPQAKALADTIQVELEKVFPIPSEVARIKRIVDQARERTSKFAGDVNAWFDTVMDRTTDEFRQWTRWITVAGAVALPLVFHIDSLQIVRQLASDPELRAKVIQSTDATLNKATQVFALTEQSKKLASEAIQRVCEDKDCKEIIAAYPVKSIASGLAGRADGEKALREKLAGCKDPNQVELVAAAYQKHFDNVADENLKGLLQRANDIKAGLDEYSLTLFSIGKPWGSYWGYWTDGMHILGMLMTVVFLSLGAPFWYNVLRQLSNLRPAIAQKIDQTSQPQG